MPASLDRIRRTMKVQPTARDKGLKLTLEVVAYDNGLVEVDTVPINDIVNDPDPAAHGWLGAAEVAVLTLGEFRRQVERRQQERRIDGTA
jgi:hypothetical protein